LKSDPLSECQEELLATVKNQKKFYLDLQKASLDVKYNLIIEKLDKSEENFKKIWGNFKKSENAFEEFKKHAVEQLNTTNGELNDIRAQLRSTVAQLNITNGKLNDIRAQLNTTVAQLNITNGKLNNIRAQLNITNGKLNNIRAQLNITNGELNDISDLSAQLDITNGKLNDIREEIWPVVRAEAISLAVQVLVVFSGGQPQNPPLPMFVPIWMKDKKCKTILEKVMGLKTDRKSTCSSQRSCSIWETDRQESEFPFPLQSDMASGKGDGGHGWARWRIGTNVGMLGVAPWLQWEGERGERERKGGEREVPVWMKASGSERALECLDSYPMSSTLPTLSAAPADSDSEALCSDVYRDCSVVPWPVMKTVAPTEWDGRTDGPTDSVSFNIIRCTGGLGLGSTVLWYIPWLPCCPLARYEDSGTYRVRRTDGRTDRLGQFQYHPLHRRTRTRKHCALMHTVTAVLPPGRAVTRKAADSEAVTALRRDCAVTRKRSRRCALMTVVMRCSPAPWPVMKTVAPTERDGRTDGRSARLMGLREAVICIMGRLLLG
jgi:hypothetical protein